MSAWPPGDVDTAEACHQRWQQLQDLRRAEGLDALLIAIGPDASFSRANEAVFNWLLLGLSGREAMSSVSGRYEESLVCLSERNLIFCKKADFEDLTLRSARWDATSLVAPDDSDVDYYEDKKIGTFIEMVKDCQKLGVFVGQNELSQDLKMTVEKWPVVQAFGYDEFGMGFMTLNRQLVNLEPKLAEIFSFWDTTAVSWAKQTMPKLQKAWADAVLFHDQHSREEALAAAPIVDYFIYGRLDDEVNCGISPCPRLLVGKQTQQILKDEIPGETIAVDEADARQMIWEAVDPMTGVAMTRTYGLMTPFDTKMKDVLEAYAACCRCCRSLLLENVKTDVLRKATEIFRKEGLTKVPDIFDCGIDAFGAPVSTGSGLRFLRISCRLDDNSYVAYGDSTFGKTLLGETLPSFAFWHAQTEKARSLDIQNGLETALGLKLDWGRSVALGHRKDVRVYLDPPEQPPDPLDLGEEPIDVEIHCDLAVAVVTASSGGVVPVGLAAGTAWTYASGKVVVSTGRSGYVLLTLQRESLQSTAAASQGQLWVSMDLSGSTEPWLKVAISVSPSTLSTWRNQLAPPVHVGVSTGDDLWWLPLQGSTVVASAPAPTAPAPQTQKQLLVTGLPGCGAIDVAKALARLLHAPFFDLEDGTTTDSKMDQSQLLRLQQTQGEEEWLVLCDVLRDPLLLQAQLPELRVLSIMEPMIAYPWHSVRHPLLRRNAPPGAVVAVGRTGQKETQDHRALGTLLAKELQRTVGRQVLLRPLTSDLLSAVTASPHGIRAASGEVPPSPDSPVATRCFVVCGVLDLQRLRQRLTMCLREAAEQFCKTPLAKDSPCKGLFCIEVKALVVDSSEDFWSTTDLTSDGTKFLVEKNLVFTEKGELPARQHWQEPLASKHGALFWFCDCRAAAATTAASAVAAEMAQCTLQEPKEEAFWAPETVPEELRRTLVKELRSQGPPEGYSFDGNRYINQEDYRSQKDHPLLASRLSQLAEEQNSAEQHRRCRAREILASHPFARPMSPPRPPSGRCTGRPVMQRPRGVVAGGYPMVD